MPFSEPFGNRPSARRPSAGPSPSRRPLSGRSVAALAVTVAAATSASALPLLPASPAGAAPAATGVVATAPTFVLPAPSGPLDVGREVLHLTDRSRPDPWVPSRARELMVSMFYPAVRLPGRPAPYLSVAEAELLIADRGATGLIEPGELSATRAAAVSSAPARRGRYPLVVLSPGFTLHRHTLTHLAEELASHGYIVATVDHAYESVGTDFPGGTLTCAACTAAGDYAPATVNRARDLSFVLDRLTGDRPAWRHARLIDRSRIGMGGHSMGGSATAATMAADPRVRAGINMDGGLFEPIPAEGLGGRPFLLLGAPSAAPAASWLRDWPKLDGWKRWLDVTGAGHLDFTDIPVFGEQAGIPDPGYPLPGSRAVQITRDYVTAFFDLHLRGIPQPLLDGPSADHPEVVFR
ncbi:alpha/beta hydrolase family protein [Actinoplanes sp. CA-252034]|uniref:alpha/beta hydrolase family protein n=1 Tax=Actinoplanes sp. CA-252034 TaxID=3239906 RepID=UPI003D96A237